MILLYTLMLFLLSAIKRLIALRARTLERKYIRTAALVDQAAVEHKPGNSSKVDPCANAKWLVHLGQLVEKRDRVEAKYFSWQNWADRFAGWVGALRDWKGKKLPYTMGAVDVWMILCLVDHFGVGQYLSATALIQFVISLYRE
jgi:hypothetical protein